MTTFWFISPAMCLIIRFYLVRENKRRQVTMENNGSQEGHDMLDMGDEVIQVHNEDLDLTDRQNLKFIYPL